MKHPIKPIFLFLLLPLLLQSFTKPDNLPEDEFARRRAIFQSQLAEINACAIIHSAPVVERNHDVEYVYRQDSDMLYLSGWEKPTSILLILAGDTGDNAGQVIMFVQPRNPKREVWTGPQPGVEEAAALPEIDAAYPYESFFDKFPELAKGYDRWVVSHAGDHPFEMQLLKSRSEMGSDAPILQEASTLLKAQRLIKSPYEIQSLEQAIQITGAALVETWPMIGTMRHEYEILAHIEYGFRKRGSPRLSFPSIVGAGKNATYLHYEDDHGSLLSGDLLLMDVGAEWNYYSADISRTVPLNGKFTAAQADIYDLVLKAQLAAIASVKPGVSFRTPHETAVRTITGGLIDLGLLQGDLETLIAEKSYRKFFMHGTSHWLGLDVHDVGGYKAANKEPHLLKEGMVLTVEPGLYISEHEDVDPKYWNIGIRIEDDVLVTKRGHRVLSAKIPKTRQEIEAIMQP